MQYHNDIHGADVLQFGYYLLKNTFFVDVAILSDLDVFSFLLACACNDYGHDGFTNFYHINKVTERAIRFNDVAVQEQHTIAEIFSLIMKTGLLSHMSRDNFKRFRKRLTGMILATDIERTLDD